MAVIRDIMKLRPLGLWAGRGTNPIDYSGYANSFDYLAGSISKQLNFTNGNSYSWNIDTSNIARYATNIWRAGTEKNPFSLHAVFSPNALDDETQQLVLGRNGDGISISSTQILFTISFQTAPAAVVTYNIEENKIFHVVCNYNHEKISMYINNELVGETDLTPDQVADKFANTDSYIYSGGTINSNNSVCIGLVSLYSRNLNVDEIYYLYSNAMLRYEFEEIGVINSAWTLPLSFTKNNIAFDYSYNTDDKWYGGQLNNVAVSDGQLKPLISIITSVPGQWNVSVPFDALPVSSIYGVYFEWEGTGAVITASIDGGQTETVSKSSYMTSINSNTAINGKFLNVNVAFPGGIDNDPSYVSELRIVIVESASYPAFSRTVTNLRSYQRNQFSTISMSDLDGTYISNFGNLSISGDTSSDNSTVGTIEMIVNRIGTQTLALGGYTKSVTTYINGVASDLSNLPQGQFSIVHIVLSASYNGELTISGESIIGGMNIYDANLSQSDINNSLARFNNTNIVSVIDTSSVGVTETSASIKIYAYDWAISGT